MRMPKSTHKNPQNKNNQRTYQFSICIPYDISAYPSVNDGFNQILMILNGWKTEENNTRKCLPTVWLNIEHLPHCGKFISIYK